MNRATFILSKCQIITVCKFFFPLPRPNKQNKGDGNRESVGLTVTAYHSYDCARLQIHYSLF